MDLNVQRMSLVSTIGSDLSNVLNVADEQKLLQQCMSPEAVQECIQGGDTNMARVKLLCGKMVKDLQDGNTKMYDTLCQYFLNRCQAYQSMHQRFTLIGSTNNGASSNSKIQSKYQPMRNGLPIASGAFSEMYLWQRKSDGIIFTMKRYKQVTVNDIDC